MNAVLTYHIVGLCIDDHGYLAHCLSANIKN